MNEHETSISAAGFNAFAEVIAKSDFGVLLDSGAPFTIFAPTDDAFAKFCKSSLDRMENDASLMRSVVGYHLAAGKVLSQRFAGKRIRAATQAGQSLIISDSDGLHVNKARLVLPDILMGASVVHGIDAVLWPRDSDAVH